MSYSISRMIVRVLPSDPFGRGLVVAAIGAGAGEWIYGRRETHLPVVVGAAGLAAVSAGAGLVLVAEHVARRPLGAWPTATMWGAMGAAVGAILADAVGDTLGGGTSHQAPGPRP